MNMLLKDAVDNFDEIFGQMSDDEFFAEFRELGVVFEPIEKTKDITQDIESDQMIYYNSNKLLLCA